jgi:hypothetical protein
MLNEQFTWLTPLSQLEWSELTWRTGNTEARKNYVLGREKKDSVFPCFRVGHF